MTTTQQLLDAIAALRHYARHEDGCGRTLRWGTYPDCSCGWDNVLRGIDAMLAGRVTNCSEAPKSSTEPTA